MRFLVLIFVVLFNFSLSAQSVFNGNMEQLDSKNVPKGWDFTFNNYNTFIVKLDSNTKIQGKYSVSIESGNSKAQGSAISYIIPDRFKGKRITLIGSIKTENVSEGFAGLWLRTDGPNGKVLDFNNMESQHLKGTQDWKEYMIEIPYREETVTKLNLGALLMGKGKIWVDSLRLYIDLKPVDIATRNQNPIVVLPLDTTFVSGSDINQIPLSNSNLKKLSILAEYWSFLKYHHPFIASGQVNWDAALFKMIPIAVQTQSNIEFSKALEQVLANLPTPKECTSCPNISSSDSIAVMPNYGNLFTSKILQSSLKEKLKFILKNRNIGPNYFVGINMSYGNPGNPQFDNENSYPNIKFPDIGYQLLSVFRYYGIIKYFYPNRNLIGKNWEHILKENIELAIRPLGLEEYTKMMVKFISAINDGHATVRSTTFENIKGAYRLPFKAIFVRNKLIIAGFYNFKNKSELQLGDEIISINGESVKSLIKKYWGLTSASNREGKLQNMIGSFLLRSNDIQFKLSFKRNGDKSFTNLVAVKADSINFYDQDIEIQSPGYKIINAGVAYINPKKFNLNWRDLENELSKTKGIIIDFRTYPNSQKTYELIDYLKPISSPFVLYSYVKADYPGLFRYTAPLSNGGKSDKPYAGKVVVLVNSLTISQAEATTMSFQSSKNTTVVGSKTAGADGSASKIYLPGGLETGISGIGMFYPDKTNTQRTGIKIDYKIIPTINGIKTGKDELLDNALEIILGK